MANWVPPYAGAVEDSKLLQEVQSLRAKENMKREGNRRGGRNRAKNKREDTDSRRQRVLDARAGGKSQKAIAIDEKVSASTISRIIAKNSS
jgi:DNA-binding NarL/FixJ family response regulator